jgi:hypothetical protein
MQGLSAAGLLAVWEQGHWRNPGERAILILAAASTETPAEAWGGVTVGQRDRMLFEVRERTFGRQIEASVRCPACAEALEFSLLTPEMLGDELSRSDPTAAFSWTGAAGMVAFRLPTAGDLAAIGDAATGEEAEAAIIARCVVETSGDFAAGFPPELADAISSRIAVADPAAEVLLDLSCPACGHTWQDGFDIAGFFWTELAAQARRLLLEVDTLARAYGWSEADILALSPVRRQAYLQLARG